MALLDVKKLGRIDWNFPGAGTARGSIQSIHWFPGNFISQIPSALIQTLSNKGDTVLDPFAGSATTGVEAIRLGRSAIVSDRLSASGLISDAKLALLTQGLSTRISDEINEALTFDQQCRADIPGRGGEGSDPSLALWYSKETLSQLHFLWRLIETYPYSAKRILVAVFSEVLFQCASTGGSITTGGKKRRHHWGWVADNVIPKAPIDHNVIAMFRLRLDELPSDELSLHDASATMSIVRQDARSLALNDSTIDLVVTSPPYIGMIDYTHANRLLYAWMGWSLKDERQAEIGARFRRSRKNAVSEYVADMRTACDEINRVLRSGSYCAIILGQSKRFPGTVDAVLSNFGARMSLVWGPIPRNPTRRRVSERAAGEPVEYIAVFQKP